MAYGELGAGITRLRGEFGFESDDLTTYSAGAYINLTLAAGLNVQVEGRGYRVDWAGNFSASDTGAFAHVYWRDAERFAVGGFVGQTSLSLYGMLGNMLTGGAEAQAYLGALTLYGQAAGFDSKASSGWLYFNGYFLRGAARFFATPNLRLQFDAQWARIENSDSTDALSLVGTAEYRLTGTPL